MAMIKGSRRVRRVRGRASSEAGCYRDEAAHLDWLYEDHGRRHRDYQARVAWQASQDARRAAR